MALDQPDANDAGVGLRGMSANRHFPLNPHKRKYLIFSDTSALGESRCGAVAVGRTYLFPPLSFGGALAVRPLLRFHIPLIEPDMQISRIRLVWGFLCQGYHAGITSFLSSSVIPFFCSTRAASILPPRPHISIAVARNGGQGRRFFSAAEGLSLTDASTAAGCRRSGGWPRDDPRGACHWPRSIARTMLVFG